MDSDTVVVDQQALFGELLHRLEARDVCVSLLFLAKLSDDSEWFLYLCSPFVDQHGPLEAYGRLVKALREDPPLDVDSSMIRVLGDQDSLTKAVKLQAKSTGLGRVMEAIVAVPPLRNPGNCLPSFRRIQGKTLAGISFDELLVATDLATIAGSAACTPNRPLFVSEPTANPGS